MLKELIGKIPFFNGLSDGELQKIIAIGEEINVESSQLIFEEGDSGDHLFIIIEGQVRVFHKEDGEETPISTLEKGAFFGEMALIDGRPRSASVKTLTACHFFVLEREYFLKLLASSIHILSRIMQGLSGKVRRLSQDFVDTSLQKQYVVHQAEIKRHQAISQMVAGVAHEINTPISIAYQGATFISDTLTLDTISELAKDEVAKEALIDIFNASKLIINNIIRADKLINSFKNLSVRQSTDAPERVDMKALIEELLALYPTQQQGSKLTIEIDNRLEQDSQWLGYPGVLTQVLLNLINNAQIHAYPEDSPGNVKIILTSNVDNFILQVQDFGCGIRKENIDQIFTAFYTTRRSQGGTGLGMAIVHNLVTSELQGTINLNSKFGHGTTVTVELPKRLKLKKPALS